LRGAIYSVFYAPEEGDTFIDSESSVDDKLESMFASSPEEVTDEAEAEEVAEVTEEVEEEVEVEESVETEEETEEVAEETPTKESKKLDPELQAIVDDRIGKELGKLRHEHREEIKKLQEAQEKASKPTAAIDQVKTSWSHGDLDNIEVDAEEIIDFVEDNPDGFTQNAGTDKERFVEAAELRAMKKNARNTLKELRSRRKLIDQSEQHNASVVQAFPGLSDPESEESKAVENVFRLLPALKEQPNSKLLAIHMIRGEAQWLQELEGNRTPTKKKVAKKAAKKPEIVKAPTTGGNPSESPALSGKKEKTGKEFAEEAAAGDEDAVDNELLRRFG
jgi:hypothetical protein